MQHSSEILIQQLQDAELGGFEAQKIYAPPYRSLLTEEEIMAKSPKYAAVNILLYPKDGAWHFPLIHRTHNERDPKYGTPYNYTGPSVFNNDGGHAYTYAWNAGTISPIQLQQIIGVSIAFSKSDYQLLLNNCSDFATYALMIAGINCNNNGIDTPNTVAELIENMAQNLNGNAPQTHRNCP